MVRPERLEEEDVRGQVDGPEQVVEAEGARLAHQARHAPEREPEGEGADPGAEQGEEEDEAGRPAQRLRGEHARQAEPQLHRAHGRPDQDQPPRHGRGEEGARPLQTLEHALGRVVQARDGEREAGQRRRTDHHGPAVLERGPARDRQGGGEPQRRGGHQAEAEAGPRGLGRAGHLPGEEDGQVHAHREREQGHDSEHEAVHAVQIRPQRAGQVELDEQPRPEGDGVGGRQPREATAAARGRPRQGPTASPAGAVTGPTPAGREGPDARARAPARDTVSSVAQ